jgi:hypothetical protein
VSGVDFGNFANGTIGSEIRDTSWNWSTGSTGSPSHQKVTLLTGGGLNGINAVRLIGDDSMTFPNQGARVRIHAIGINGGEPSWWPSGTDVKKHIVRVVALRVPSGALFTNTENVTTDEQHGPNGSGSVMNLCSFTRGGYWRHYVRGNDQITGSYDFQWIFGPNDSSPVGPQNDHQDFAGGNLPVTLDQWVVFLYSVKFGPDGTGSFEEWHRTESDSDWVHSVPKKSNIPVGYPTSNAPYMSLYYGTGGGAQNAVDYCGGRYFGNGATEQDNIDEAFAWANTRFGFDVPTDPTNSVRPTITGTPQQGNSLTGVAGTWSGSPTLTYQWEWDQTTGTWTNVNGATSLSFLCSATFVGAQVRLRETANGSFTATSNPVSVTAVGGGTIFRLQGLGRSGTRTINPSGRITGLGGGGL